MTSDGPSPYSIGRDARFATTRWSVVIAAGGRATPESKDALAYLCAAYWYPIYAYVRRRGHDADAAQDLTQAFFARLLEKEVVEEARRERGRFRSFLLGALKHFLANERRHARAQKRGGAVSFASLDVATAETRYAREPDSPERTPEQAYQRRWAITLLENVLRELRLELATEGRAPLFDGLKGCLTGDAAAPPYAGVAKQLNVTEGAVKVAVHRLRQRYKALLLAHVAETVADESEVEDEVRALFAALSA